MMTTTIEIVVCGDSIYVEAEPLHRVGFCLLIAAKRHKRRKKVAMKKGTVPSAALPFAHSVPLGGHLLC
jgi:hypothetical protein